MITRKWFALLISSSFTSVYVSMFVLIFVSSIVSSFASKANAAQVRVLLKSTPQDTPLRVQGFALRVQSQNWSIKEFALQKFQVERKGIGWQISDGQTTRRFNSAKLEIDGVGTSINGEPIDHTLTFAIQNKKILWVANVEMEKYLSVVLPSEMPLDWPQEALKAQMISARTYAYFQLRSRRAQNFDLYASVLDQSFNLRRKTTLSERALVKEISLQTQGLVLTQNRRPIKAFYHADCGGQLTDSKTVWNGAQPSTDQAACPEHPSRTWQVSVSPQEIASRLRDSIWLQAAISPIAKYGRVHQVKIASRGKQRVFSGNDFRELLGFDRVWSTQFSVAQKEGRFILSGIGMGHGVGMCQTGAKYAAIGGEDFRQILKRYYPKSNLSSFLKAEPNSYGEK